TGSPISRGRPIRTACSHWRSCRTAIRNRRRPRCGAVRRWGCAAAISRSSAWAFRCGITTGMRCGPPAGCHFPISFHSTGFKAARAPDTPEMEKEYAIEYRLVRSALFQTDTMEVLVSLLASGACERYPDFNFVLGESGVTWLPYIFDRLDTEYH